MMRSITPSTSEPGAAAGTATGHWGVVGLMAGYRGALGVSLASRVRGVDRDALATAARMSG